MGSMWKPVQPPVLLPAASSGASHAAATSNVD